MKANEVPPGRVRYVVTNTKKHKTLKAGDVVVMTKSPETFQNYLYRPSDCTLHAIHDEFNYVELTKLC